MNLQAIDAINDAVEVISETKESLTKVNSTLATAYTYIEEVKKYVTTLEGVLNILSKLECTR